jgi:hypothetical protein
MPSQLGFKHLGSIPADIGAFAADVGRLKPSWMAFRRRLALARFANLNPESWMCAHAALQHCPNLPENVRRGLHGYFLKSLIRCEYKLLTILTLMHRTSRILPRS